MTQARALSQLYYEGVDIAFRSKGHAGVTLGQLQYWQRWRLKRGLSVAV